MSEWPDYDLETEKIFKERFKPFIDAQMKLLAEYDARRPQGITYVFHEHSKRVAIDVRNTCLHMKLGERVAQNMYWALLPHDIGKRRLPLDVWDHEDKPGGELKDRRREHTKLGVQIAEEELGDIKHPFKDLMIDIMLKHHEQLNGQGYMQMGPEDLSQPVRLAAIVEDFDGGRIYRPHYGKRDTSIPGVLDRMRTVKAGFFDKKLFEAFEEMKLAEYNGPQEPMA